MYINRIKPLKSTKISNLAMYKDYFKDMADLNDPNLRETLTINTIDLEKVYNKEFIKMILEWNVWLDKFTKNFTKIGTNAEEKYIDQIDIFGNTPLHLASIKGVEVNVNVLRE
jgi:ankyrin repeat protein